MKGEAHSSTGHSIVRFSGGTVTLDSTRYPFCYNYDPSTSKDINGVAAITPYVPFSKNLNRLMLKVTNLGIPVPTSPGAAKPNRFLATSLPKA